MADDISLIVGVDYSELTGLVKTTAQTKAALGSIAKEFANSGSQKAYMAGINKLVVAQNNLDKSARMSRSEIMKLGAQMKQEAQFANALTRATTGLGGSLQQAGRRTNQLGVLMQQTGYQVGDFAVQVQSGTNVMVALGQQATQLVGTFGMLAKSTRMIGLFAGLGIAIPIITGVAAAFMRMRDQAEEAEDTLLNLSKVQEGLARKTQEATLAIYQQEKGLKNLEEAFVSKKIEDARVALEAYKNETKELVAETLALAKAEREANPNMGVTDAELEELAAQTQKALLQSREKELKVLQDTYNELVTIRGLEEGRILSAKIQEDQLNSHLSKMTDIFEKTKELKEKLGDAVYEATRLSNLDLQSPINLAAIAASNLSGDMKSALASALGLVDLSVKYGMMEGSEGAKRLRKYGDRGTTSDKDPTLDGESIYKKPPRVSSAGGTTPKDPAKELEKFMAQQEQANALQKQGIMLGEESVRVTELINKYKEAGLPLDLQRIQNLAEEEQRLQTLQYAHDSLTNALMSVVDGTQSVGQAFKGLIVDMLLEIYRQQVAKNFASTVLGLFGFANGGVFSNGSQVNAFADGGVVGGPTYFPMSGGQTGLMGEAGPEAIMPLKRGANGKLGVQMEGGGDTTVVNNFNISANGDESVKRIIQQQIPRISEATKAAVVDSKRRGGSFGGAFS